MKHPSPFSHNQVCIGSQCHALCIPECTGGHGTHVAATIVGAQFDFDATTKPDYATGGSWEGVKEHMPTHCGGLRHSCRHSQHGRPQQYMHDASWWAAPLTRPASSTPASCPCPHITIAVALIWLLKCPQRDGHCSQAGFLRSRAWPLRLPSSPRSPTTCRHCARCQSCNV